MIDIEIALPANPDFKVLETEIEAQCEALHLICRMKASLGKFPGSTHWHYGRKSVSGTLELTIWPKSSRAWISVHSNRQSEWIPECVDQLKQQLEREAR